MGEIVFLALLAGAAGLYFYQTLGYAMPKLDNSGGPAIFPKFVCIVLICLIIIRIVTIIAKKEKKPFHFIELFKGSTGLLFVSFVIFVVVVKPLGFILASFLFLTFVSNALHYVKLNTLGSGKSIVFRELLFILFPVLLYYFFTNVLFIALPAGILKGIL